ncbi:MAG: dockerin type I domain-containing protein [Gammaproteobacteria bacterium]
MSLTLVRTKNRFYGVAVRPIRLMPSLVIALTGATASADPITYLDQEHLVAAYGNNVYRYVTSAVDWNAALAAASTYSWNGKTGHLVTVTSLSENDFIYAAFVGPRIAVPGADDEQATPWIALSDSVVEGTWRWQAGPELGEVAAFTNWNLGELNGSSENFAVLHWQDRGLGTGKWYDYPAAGGSGSSGGQTFVVEFEGAIEPITLADDFTYNACAQSLGGVIRLTNPGGFVPATCTYDVNGNLKGTAFASTPLTNAPGASFAASFAYRIQGGGDGLAFILQNDPRGATAAGGGGEGQGWGDEWQGSPAITPIWRIVVDTFQNSLNPSDNYIGFSKNFTQADAVVGILSPAFGFPPYDLNSGSTQYVWVDYSAATQLLAVYASATNTKPQTELFRLGGQDLTELGAQFYVGFSAGSGASTAIHDIEQFTFRSPVPDIDGDGIYDASDNCVLMANPTQLDSNADGYGNICDADLNSSGSVTAADYAILRSVLNLAAASSQTAAGADFNGSGTVTAADYAILRSKIGTAPGPSGLACAGTIPCP